MEDLAGKLTQMLGNPEMMSQIQNLINSMGNNNSQPKQEDFSTFEEPPVNDNSYSENENLNADMIKNIMKFAPLLTSVNKEDKYSKFICALKPLLSEKRKKKLDDASKILNIMKVLPILKNQGFF